jgi:DNA end-binding protein Ku
MTKKTTKKTKTAPRKTAKAKVTKLKTKKAKPHNSERGLWTGSISFGLINIPVRLVTAKEQQDVHFTMLDPSNLSKVGYKYYNKATGEDVSRSATVKGYEYEKGSYVVLSEQDFKKAYPKTTGTIDIQNCVSLREIDPVFFEKAYYLMPTKGGEKSYRLLAQALNKQDKVAIAKIVMHTKQHLVALISRGDYLLMETLHFAADVKELRELEDAKQALPAAKVAPKEVEMAERLIENMTEKWDPDAYEDTFRDDIMKLVHAKVKAGKGTEVPELEAASDEEDHSNVRDLMPLLRKSLESKKHAATKHHKTAE